MARGRMPTPEPARAATDDGHSGTTGLALRLGVSRLLRHLSIAELAYDGSRRVKLALRQRLQFIRIEPGHQRCTQGVGLVAIAHAPQNRHADVHIVNETRQFGGQSWRPLWRWVQRQSERVFVHSFQQLQRVIAISIGQFEVSLRHQGWKCCPGISPRQLGMTAIEPREYFAR